MHKITIQIAAGSSRPALLVLVIVLLASTAAPAQEQHPAPAPLLSPALLEHDALQAGNPLATYGAMCDREREYLDSPLAEPYRQIRLSFEEFLGEPEAGPRAMQLPMLRQDYGDETAEVPPGLHLAPAVEVIAQAAADTPLVIFGEEHHLPQTRSLYEPMLRALHARGYRYLAAETFTDEFARPPAAGDSGANAGAAPAPALVDSDAGFYVRDPLFASAVRLAQSLGYELVAYDTDEAGPPGDAGFRDRVQAQRLKARVFDQDPDARLLVLAGRGHASERAQPDGWVPMAAGLKALTGIDPFTLFAPTMGPRLTRGEEHPLYRAVAAGGGLDVPSILVDGDGRPYGFDSCDAYVFWPRSELVDGRPDWMVRTLGRTPLELPRSLRDGSGLRLVQAFEPGQPDRAVPCDQVLLRDGQAAPALMLPGAGRYRVRVIERDGTVVAEEELTVK